MRELRAQGKRTRARLLGAGMTVLGERGYQATRIDDIVRRARTSHGTFYQYFSGKDDLVRALAHAAADDMASLGADLGPVGPDAAGRDELRRFVGGFHEAYERHGPVIRAWAENQLDAAGVVDLGLATFGGLAVTVAGRVRGADGRHVAPDLAAVLLLATLERLSYFLTSRPLGLPADALHDELAGMLHRGFFGAPGPARQRRATPRRATRSRSR